MIKKDFNNGWSVTNTGDMVGALLGEEQLPPKPVTLPHDAMILNPRKRENPSQNSGGFFPGGDYIYTKEFMVDQSSEGKNFYLEFEGIYERGQVYINGNFAGSIDCGYTRLIIEIADYLIFGEKNTISVRAYNSSQPNSRWYTGSGLYRPVNLYIGDSMRIPIDGVKITTPEVAEDIAKVVINTQIDYTGNVVKRIVLRTEIMSGEDMVAYEVTPVTIQRNKKIEVEQKIYVRNPLLWTIDWPNIYVCKIRLIEDEQELDVAENTFGIRKLRLDPVNGLRLNEDAILLRGACIHHDHGALGTASFSKAEERKIKCLKEAGFNAVRISHHSATKSLLDACDRQGMLVIDEVFDVWNHCKVHYDYSLRFAKNWERDIEDLVAKDFNHPSVFMYSYGNEIQELASVAGAFWSRRIAKKLRKLDSTRYITNSINGLSALENKNGEIAADMGLLSKTEVKQLETGEFKGDINELMTVLHGAMNEMAAHTMIEDAMHEAYSCLDACGLNYMRDCYELYQKKYPNRITFGSETLPPDIARNWEKVEKLSSCIGDFTWTGWDYIGESGVGIIGYDSVDTFFKPYPAYLAYVGDLDITGYRRPASYFREIVFGLRKIPYLAVQDPKYYGRKESKTPWTISDAISSWSWPGCEGETCKVEIYSPSDEVELRLNGTAIGRYPTGKENQFTALAEIEYEPGIIEAVPYTDGKSGESYQLCTVLNDYKLKIVCEDKELEAGEEDLAYLMIYITDQKETIHTEQDFKVSVKVLGAAALAGFATADPVSEENFYDTVRTTYEGRAQVIVRSGEQAGYAEVLIEAEKCEPVSIYLKVRDRK